MRLQLKRGFAVLIAVVMIFAILSACGSSELCSDCRSTPTKGYDNKYTGEKDYYCKECASDCAFCSGKATEYYTSGLGGIVFVCDECYEEIRKLNS